MLCPPPDSDFVEKFFNYTLHRIEVPAAVHAQRKLLALVGKLGQRKLFRNIDRSQLIKTHIFISPVVIGGQGGEHAV